MISSYITTDGLAVKFRQRKPDLPEPHNSLLPVSPEVAYLREQIDSVYENIVHWKKNIFELPTCSLGRKFVKELRVWLQHFNNGSEYQCIAIKTFMIFKVLVHRRCIRIHLRKFYHVFS